MISFRNSFLCALLGVTMVAQLISVSASSCKTCTGHILAESFSVKNFLPAGDSNLYMECSCVSRCGKLTVQDPVDIKECHSVETSTRFCGSTPDWPLGDLDAYRAEQMLCEFIWTRPNSETIYRTPVMVWTREGPKRTFYKVDASGFWFSNGADAQWNLMLGWTMSNYISSEVPLKGAGNSVFETFGNEHCRTKNYAY
ncbi:hypothetical protein MPTK1_3g13440 [Marchantia polymorpha subsp. ruderalis]|uniref:Uncharacterized protein n=1 Tax=Marchantia polymorpha subsp. ruderalis TaxID=1480154 RepID=A0AAF6B0E9_MARPO|nr:hypothetical protein Mp_3g13440 [Marchantia polymorpha subsp. ruderalis]